MGNFNAADAIRWRVQILEKPLSDDEQARDAEVHALDGRTGDHASAVAIRRASTRRGYFTIL